MVNDSEGRLKSRQLEARIEYLETQQRFTLNLLEMASSLGDFQTAISRLQDPSVILREAASRMDRILPVSTQAFFLTDEADSDFTLALALPPESASELDALFGLCVDKGIVAWALKEKRAVFPPSDDGGSVLMHALATGSRVRGLYLARLDPKAGPTYDYSLSLLSILMLHCANALESFGLYHWIQQINAELEQKVEELSRSEQELKLHRDHLEELVRARTSELHQAVQQLTTATADKDVLLREVHHRVKNNLQLISSLLSLELRRSTAEPDAPYAAEVLRNVQQRIRCLALVHELVVENEQGEVRSDEFFCSLAEGLLRLLSPLSIGYQLRFAVDAVAIPMDTAVPSGFLLGELLSNCVKHAFTDGRPGSIDVEFERRNSWLRLAVCDDGVGLPRGFDVHNDGSMGMMLLSTLATQLDAEVNAESVPGRTKLELHFPLKPSQDVLR